MTRRIEISEDLKLPLDWMLMTSVVYGAKGAGKSTLGAVVAEEVHEAGQRFCAIDLKGDWHGLRSSADGKSAAIPLVIFGGDHADLPLEPDAGAFIGEVVAELKQSCILDLEHLSKGKQIRFLSAFFEALYDKNREPLLVIADEAQRYAPQKPTSPEAQVCLGHVEDFAKLGRKHGLGAFFITQRGAGLNKEVAELADILFVCRCAGPLDQKRVREVLEINIPEERVEEIMKRLSGLDTGMVAVASAHPSLKAHGIYRVRARRTFDSSATPRIGKRRRAEPKALAKPELTAIREKMANAIERAKAEDPKELRKRITMLERDLAVARRPSPLHEPAPAKVKVEKVVVKEKPVIKDAQIKRMEKLTERAATLLSEARQLGTDLAAACHRARVVVSTPTIIKTVPPRSPEPAATFRQSYGPRVKVPRDSNGEPKLPKGAREILVALATMNKSLSVPEVAAIAGIPPRSSTMRNYRSMLKVAGLIEVGGDGRLTLTEIGAGVLGEDLQLQPKTSRELLAFWMPKLPGGAREMLSTLTAAYPSTISRTELGERSSIDPSSSTFRNYMSMLKVRGLVTVGGDSVGASETLFQGDR